MTAPSWGAKGEKKHYICIQKEKAHKNMLGFFVCVLTLSWGQGLTWSVVDIPRVTPLVQTDFFLSQKVLVTNKFWLGVGLCACFAFLCWDFVSMKRVQVLCVLSESLCVHVCSSPIVPLRSCFVGVNHYLWLLQCFCLLFCIYSWGLRRRIWKRASI